MVGIFKSIYEEQSQEYIITIDTVDDIVMGEETHGPFHELFLIQSLVDIWVLEFGVLLK